MKRNNAGVPWPDPEGNPRGNPPFTIMPVPKPVKPPKPKLPKPGDGRVKPPYIRPGEGKATK